MNNIPKKKMTLKALKLSRFSKRILAMSLDTILCMLSTWIALSFRFNQLVLINWDYAICALTSISIAIPVLFLFGFYKVIYRYVNNDLIEVLTKAIAVYTIIFSVIFTGFGIEGIPRSIGLMQPMIMFLLIAASRLFVKTWLDKHFLDKSKGKAKKEVIIYGAGISGRQLASNLLHSNEFKFLFFIDDNKNFWGGTIDGYPVKSPSYMNNLIDTVNPKELWLAMTNLSAPKRKKLLNNLGGLALHVRTLPSFSDLTNCRVGLNDVRELDVNELLGRQPVKPSPKLLQKCIFQKTVLVTGAGGSIGSEICRQIISNNPQYILLVENSELALYNIHSELELIINKKYDKNSQDIILVPLLVNVQDIKSLNHIFKTWQPYTVYHTAAYKHVPIVEYNVVSGIKNNVIGTLNCANIAIKYKVKHFVLVSTDKAVRPTNIMGASKRLAEMTLQLLSNDPKNNDTCFCMVRFGNVLNSSGSVVPLFRKQIENRVPLTLTDERVTRFFMTITEASQLVIQAGAMSLGGEVFVLDMGKPVKILDLAHKMIEANGLQVKNKKTPWGDVEIKVNGLRPGEKLYEELLIGDNPKPTKHPKILQAHEKFIDSDKFEKVMDKLSIYVEQNNINKIRSLFKKNVSGYLPSNEAVDLISNFKKST